LKTMSNLGREVNGTVLRVNEVRCLVLEFKKKNHIRDFCHKRVKHGEMSSIIFFNKRTKFQPLPSAYGTQLIVRIQTKRHKASTHAKKQSLAQL
jgi:hypothetical protein